jgi:hypothetical protein
MQVFSPGLGAGACASSSSCSRVRLFPTEVVDVPGNYGELSELDDTP